jgi:oxygen-independent coproporphyrinogen-3 oxidase
MGVQDFNPEVQKLVNRFQPQEVTEKLTVESRDLGFESVNFDLIYGLPRQTPESVRTTAEITVKLRPDRIALYSFAFVPWIKPSQRLFTEADLPTGEAKRKLYEIAREILMQAGYFEIGMDHFALPTDSLFKADQAGTLHRNFMGYTDRRTSVMLGLGVSSISETPTCFHQNEKVLPVYEREINSGSLATHRGHLLTKEDQHAREQILQLMTQWKVQVPEQEVGDLREILAPLMEDGLVHITGQELSITPEGRPFLRNACMAFDRRMRRKLPQTKIFSQAL